MYVRIASEEALIVWDPATHTEQFIRRASFFGQAPQFGFLVPTPSVPELAKTDSGVFETLAGTFHSHLVPRPQYGLKLVSLLQSQFALRTASLTKGDVQPITVLDSEQVAGYDAVVLRADDAKSLTRWLNDHGYEAPRAMQAWLRPRWPDTGPSRRSRWQNPILISPL